MTLMKYLVGLDSSSTDSGAIRFAAYAHETSTEFTTLHAAHVVPPALQDIAEKATAWTKNRLVEAGDEGAFESTESLCADSPSLGLAHRAQELGVDALVLGRKATSAANGLIRLGRVARRTLRELPAPTIIVPPDYQPHTLGDGPIIVATDLGERSRGAAMFAKRLAAAHGRALLVAHIVREGSALGLGWMPVATEDRLFAQLRLEGETSLGKWTSEHGLADAKTAVETGEPCNRILDLVASYRASIVVCGTRRLSAAARVFSVSVGSTLASNSPCPVAVVPPEWVPA